MKVDIQSPCYYEPLRGGQDCFVRNVILFRVTEPREGSTLRGEEHATAKSILVGGEVRLGLKGLVMSILCVTLTTRVVYVTNFNDTCGVRDQL